MGIKEKSVIDRREIITPAQLKEYVENVSINPLVVVKEPKKVIVSTKPLVVKESKQVVEALKSILGNRARFINGKQKILNIFKELYYEEFDRQKGLSDRDTVVIEDFEWFSHIAQRRSRKKFYNSLLQPPRVLKWPNKLTDCPREFAVTSRIILVVTDLAQAKKLGI